MEFSAETLQEGTDLSKNSMLSASDQRNTKLIRYKAINEHLCCDLNNEAVILSLDNGKYYGINSVGSRIWELLQKPVSFLEIEQTILDEYDVAEEICRQEISRFLELMAAEGLIKPIYEAPAELF
jgi:hypothetical protein